MHEHAQRAHENTPGHNVHVVMLEDDEAHGKGDGGQHAAKRDVLCDEIGHEENNANEQPDAPVDRPRNEPAA